MYWQPCFLYLRVSKAVVVVLRTLLQKACNKSKKPPPTALLAALTKLKQALPDVVDFAAESALWTEVDVAAGAQPDKLTLKV